MASRRQPVFVGRSRERAVLDRLLEDVRRGRSAVLVLRGDEGAGKTALLHHCARQASGFRVARVAGVESEMELPFATLHQLCAPMLGRLDALPAPQARALRVAFGLAFGEAPGRLGIALAALNLLAEVAAERPLLVLVDDAQWLDAASAQALGFIARRLGAEPVAIVVAVRHRPGAPELAGLPELAVAGLEEADARALLATVLPGPLDERVRDRLVAETGGNPLALLELAPRPAATQAPGEFGLAPAHGLSERVEQSFLRRLERLGDDARRLVLVAAAEPVGDPLLLRRAAERLGVGAGAAGEADDLLRVGDRVTFRHPLVRSVVYRSAPPDERRAVHLALAEATDPQADADRRAWHRAAGTLGPDEEVASELERSAGRAQARGGYAAAAAFLQRAVALTRAPARRADRALAAAEAGLHAGAFGAALEALAAAEAGALDDLQAARAQLLRGRIAFASGQAADACGLLAQAARRLAPLDLALARETYLGALGAALFAGPAGADDLLAVGHAVRALPRPAGPARAVDVLLDGLGLLVAEGRGPAAPVLLEATRAFAGDGASAEESARWGWMASAASSALWDDDGLRAVCRRQIGLARAAGALEHLPLHLIALATATARAGDVRAATSLVAEAEAVTAATGTRMAPYVAEMLLAALGGREAELAALRRAATAQAAGSGQGVVATVAAWSSAILHNGRGRYEAAMEAARSAVEAEGDQFASMWASAELVEAAVRAGAPEVARGALERLAATTRPAGTDFGLGIEARSRALLADGDAAPLHQEAIERLGRTQVRAELARAHLLHGEWLRRGGHRRLAREQLRLAHELFAAMGMTAFDERAGRELLATGETVRRRATETRDALTPQEAQIARLAAEGLSNPEIGERLFLSPRTVEWHLKKVFVKLGIGSRRRLRDALEGVDADVPVAQPVAR
jgi:DNA-binding CsgD family transcriptional regulator